MQLSPRTSISQHIFQWLLTRLEPRKPQLDIQADELISELSAEVLRLMRLGSFLPSYESTPLAWSRFQLHSSCRLLMRPKANQITFYQAKLKLQGRDLSYTLIEPAEIPEFSPLILYFHGGGWTLGRHHSFDRELSHLASSCRCRIASFDYRLAPEHPFPAALDDIHEAHLAANRGQITSFSKLVLAGDSAGANLVACHINQMNKRQHSLPSAQVLIYPVTDLSMTSESHQKFANGFILTRTMMQWFRANYLKGTPANFADPKISPLLENSLSNSPPTLIVTAGYDILRDEGLSYGRKLEEAGVSVTHCHYPGLIHGFLGMTGILPEAARACDDLYQHLYRLL